MAAPVWRRRAEPRPRPPRTRTSRPDMLYSAQRVRSKTRMAVRRREDVIEQEEMESGELNILPYLDLVTTLMRFLRPPVPAGLILVQIDTTLPDKSTAAPAAAVTPATNPDEQ